MFRLADKHFYWWPCTAKVPVDGKFEEQDFQLQFQTIDPKEADEIDKAIVEASARGDYSKTHELLRRAVIGWKGVVGAGSADAPFDAAALEQAIAMPWFRLAAYRGWQESQNGIERARGN